MQNGITASTAVNMQVGEGVFLTDYTPGQVIDRTKVLSATRGDTTFTAIPTMRTPEINGLPAHTKEFTVIDEYETVSFKTKLVESDITQIKLTLPGVTVSTLSNIETMTPSHTIKSTDYQDIWWIGNKNNGGMVAIKILNCLNTTGLTYVAANKGEGTYDVELTGHYDIESVDSNGDFIPPFEIYDIGVAV